MSASPTPPNHEIPPYWMKQSDMLQGVINRMAANSLEVKKFGVTVWTAIVGFGVQNDNNWFFVLAFAAVIVFGVLDLYYLFLERKFRENFGLLSRLINGYGSNHDHEWARDRKGNFLSLAGSAKFIPRLPSTMASWANLPYLIMLAVTVMLFFVQFPPANGSA